MKKPLLPDNFRELPPGQLVDILYKLRQERKNVEDSADTIKKMETLVEDYLLDAMPKAELTRLSGKLANVSISKKVMPTLVDREKLNVFIKKHNAYDLYQSRLSPTAVAERWDAGLEIPGVDRFTKVSLSVTKLAKPTK
jgi:hypothetical protein